MSSHKWFLLRYVSCTCACTVYVVFCWKSLGWWNELLSNSESLIFICIWNDVLVCLHIFLFCFPVWVEHHCMQLVEHSHGDFTRDKRHKVYCRRFMMGNYLWELNQILHVPLIYENRKMFLEIHILASLNQMVAIRELWLVNVNTITCLNKIENVKILLYGVVIHVYASPNTCTCRRRLLSNTVTFSENKIASFTFCHF